MQITKGERIVAEALGDIPQTGMPVLTEDHPFLRKVIAYMQTRKEWLGTATDLLNAVGDTYKLSGIIQMYSVYHEMDISKYIEAMEAKCSEPLQESKLKVMRESRGLSQSELAKESGVKLRNIQMYEQRINDIDRAQAQTVYKLARVIGCNVEDLLENPMT